MFGNFRHVFVGHMCYL